MSISNGEKLHKHAILVKLLTNLWIELNKRFRKLFTYTYFRYLSQKYCNCHFFHCQKKILPFYYLLVCKKLIKPSTIRCEAKPSPYGLDACDIATYAFSSSSNSFAII